MNVFEKYLTLWVAACMAVGVAAGKALPTLVCSVCNRTRGWFVEPAHCL